jgi:hypothetical protein
LVFFFIDWFIFEYCNDHLFNAIIIHLSHLILNKPVRGNATKFAIDSAFYNASCFGINSPKTSVKYERSAVIAITEMFLSTWSGTGIPNSKRNCPNGPVKKSAAKALAKNRASVIPICIVLKKTAWFGNGIIQHDCLFISILSHTFHFVIILSNQCHFRCCKKSIQ